MLHGSDTIGTPEVLDAAAARALLEMIRVDAASARAYRAAIEWLDPRLAPVVQRLTSFARDHQRHVDEIASALRQAGHRTTSPRVDVRDVVLVGMTALSSRLGPTAALRGLIELERRTCRRCDALVARRWSPGVGALVQRWCADERRHAEALDGLLRLDTWDGLPA